MLRTSSSKTAQVDPPTYLPGDKISPHGVQLYNHIHTDPTFTRIDDPGHQIDSDRGQYTAPSTNTVGWRHKTLTLPERHLSANVDRPTTGLQDPHGFGWRDEVRAVLDINE